MRRLTLIAAAACMVALPFAAHAQYGGGGPGGGGPSKQQQDDDAKKKKRDKEWGDSKAPLPAMRNAGPCPFVKALYDAARYVEFKDAKEASANVVYSGEIEGISSGCEYKDNEPIKVMMDILFELGKGPLATSDNKNYRYWVAVTDRNREVIARQTFDLPAHFGDKDRLYLTDTIANITIPRGTMTTSGANFEVLVGFEVTPQMAAFNRLGKRFRVNAAPTAVASAGKTATPTPQQ
ncbi:MAG: Tat pathway signal sequence domain protein [Proteobacteria bacterium]|nr:Tat pathway signal sequence domain protein [Pseudomonadota bacterium]